MRKHRKKLWIGLAVLVTLIVADYHLFPSLVGEGQGSYSKSKNGLWLRYKWYFGEHSPNLVATELAPRLKKHQIRDAYFHVRYIKADGSLRFRFPEHALKLNDEMREHAPDSRSIAWIFAGNGKHGDVDLSKTDVRQKMAEEAAWLVRECGFAGVQWDYEICPDRDPHFLDLLKRTRAALPIGSFLGVASPMWYPIAGVSWSDSYYGQVSKLCDQIAVMCYDSGLYFPRAYVWLVEQQVRRLPELVYENNPKCEVMFGLPTYEDGPASHNPKAENLSLALKAVRRGMSGGQGASTYTGIALFADYTTDEKEWAELERLWALGGG